MLGLKLASGHKLLTADMKQIMDLKVKNDPGAADGAMTKSMKAYIHFLENQ